MQRIFPKELLPTSTFTLPIFTSSQHHHLHHLHHLHHVIISTSISIIIIIVITITTTTIIIIIVIIIFIFIFIIPSPPTHQFHHLFPLHRQYHVRHLLYLRGCRQQVINFYGLLQNTYKVACITYITFASVDMYIGDQLL